MSILRTRTITILVLSFLLSTAGYIVPFHIPEVAGEQVSIYDIQFTEDPSGDSPYAGQEVTVTGIVTAAFGIAFGATALALALAFGLGGREVAAEYLKR